MLRVTNHCPHAGHSQSGRLLFSNARLLTTINAFRGRCHPLDDVFGSALARYTGRNDFLFRRNKKIPITNADATQTRMP